MHHLSAYLFVYSGVGLFFAACLSGTKSRGEVSIDAEEPVISALCGAVLIACVWPIAFMVVLSPWLRFRWYRFRNPELRTRRPSLRWQEAVNRRILITQNATANPQMHCAFCGHKFEPRDSSITCSIECQDQMAQALQ